MLEGDGVKSKIFFSSLLSIKCQLFNYVGIKKRLTLGNFTLSRYKDYSTPQIKALQYSTDKSITVLHKYKDYRSSHI